MSSITPSSYRMWKLVPLSYRSRVCTATLGHPSRLCCYLRREGLLSHLPINDGCREEVLPHVGLLTLCGCATGGGLHVSPCSCRVTRWRWVSTMVGISQPLVADALVREYKVIFLGCFFCRVSFLRIAWYCSKLASLETRRPLRRVETAALRNSIRGRNALA